MHRPQGFPTNLPPDIAQAAINNRRNAAANAIPGSMPAVASLLAMRSASAPPPGMAGMTRPPSIAAGKVRAIVLLAVLCAAVMPMLTFVLLAVFGLMFAG